MTELVSPIAGKICKINIAEGQLITEDDEAFIIEAMKMENVVYGEAGIVKELLVNVGDKIEEEALLAIIE